MKRSSNDDFGFEIVTEGSFIDEGFHIRTVVIRLSGTALKEYLSTKIINDRYVYDTQEEYDTYKKEKRTMRKASTINNLLFDLCFKSLQIKSQAEISEL